MDSKNFPLKLSKKQKELLNAVETGTLPQVQKLILQSRSLKKHELFGYILLVTALHREHKSLSKFLIKEDCPVKGPKTGTHCTPLYYAVKMNDLEIFKLLWMKGASASARDANEDSALELAMYENRYQMIILILNDAKLPENSKNLQRNCQDDISLFHIACWALDSKLIQIFLSHGFSVKRRSTLSRNEWKGLTPLHFVLNGYFPHGSVIKILLEHGADFYAEDNQGRTPLHLAFREMESSLFRNDIIQEHLTIPNKRRFFNPIDKNGLSLFHIFCTMSFRDGDSTKSLSYIKYFIDNKVDLNSSVSVEDEQFPGYTALLFAAEKFSWDLIELLLKKGADPRKSDKNGVTPLHLICRDIDTVEEKKRMEIVKLFLQCGAVPTARNSEGCTPLHVAYCSHYRLSPLNELERFLLSNNPQGINHTDKSGLSYLHMACLGDDLDIVKTLVTQGASINSCIHKNAPRYAGYSALHIATKFNRITFVQCLLAHGADANVADIYGSTPLHLACDHTVGEFYGLDNNKKRRDTHIDWLPSRKAHIGIIKSLIQEGALIDIKNSSGETPLLVNCRIPRGLLVWNSDKSFVESMTNEVTFRQKFVMDILLKLGADINACCKCDGNILHILTPFYPKVPRALKLLEIALKKGADVNAVGGSKKLTPLHVAVDESMRSGVYTCLINLFLFYGANINARDGNLNTPLHTALQSYHSNDYTTIRLLIHPDVDINARNHKNKTPLHLAVARCNPHCTNLLIHYGADLNAEDDDGHTPIYALLERLKEYDVDDEYVRTVLFLVLFRTMFLVRLNYHVSEEVRKILNYVSSGGLALLNSQIDEEFDHLKSERIDSFTSFYDILFKDSNAMAKHAQNHTFKGVVLSTRDGNDFSIFDSFFDKQYEIGLSRLEVLDPAKSALNSVTKVHWPDCCSEIILGYLSNDDLKFLIKSAPVVGEREKSTEKSSSSGKRKAKIPRRK